MHTCSKSSARINMDDHPVLILFLNSLPGRYDQDIIHIKLLKILFPVIDPINIFCLIHSNRTFSDIQKISETFQFLIYHGKYLFFCNFFSIYQQFSSLCLFYEKAEVGGTVVLSHLWKDIYKHLLLFQRCKRYVILDLSPFQANIVKSADDNIFRLRFCLDLKFLPFHKIHPGHGINHMSGIFIHFMRICPA